MKKRVKLVALSLITSASMLFSGLGTCVAYAEESGDCELSYEEGMDIVETESTKNIFPSSIVVDDPYVSLCSEMDNTDANNATIVDTNSVNFDMISEEGQQRWYALYSENGKITLDLTADNSANVDYDLYLWEYDDEIGEINLIAASENENVAKEHIAMMVNQGVYFVLVNGYSGYDALNDYKLGIGYSDSYDSNEIDDTLSDAVVMQLPFGVNGTIDNMFDYDFVKFSLPQSGAVTLSLNNNGNNNIYRMDLYNSAGNAIGYLTQGQSGRATLAAGNYYIRTSATSFVSASDTYSISCSFSTSASRVNITSAGNAYINYGQGQYWRIENSATVTGTAYDNNGNPIPNANIEIRVPVVVGNAVKTATTTTDNQGNFSVVLNLGSGAGQYMYDSGVSYHYYDVVPIYFYSNGTQINSNITKIYHFAYSIYHRF